MADPLRHRQTKGAATDMVDLTPPRTSRLYPEQRPRPLGRRDRRALSQTLANRIAVSLAQAASQNPHLSRSFRKRHSPADPCRDDRLFAAAHRRARQPLEPARTALCRSRAHSLVRAPIRHRPRQAPIQPAYRFRCSKTSSLSLTPDFPGQPCGNLRMALSSFMKS